MSDRRWVQATETTLRSLTLPARRNGTKDLSSTSLPRFTSWVNVSPYAGLRGRPAAGGAAAGRVRRQRQRPGRRTDREVGRPARGRGRPPGVLPPPHPGRSRAGSPRRPRPPARVHGRRRPREGRGRVDGHRPAGRPRPARGRQGPRRRRRRRPGAPLPDGPGSQLRLRLRRRGAPDGPAQARTAPPPPCSPSCPTPRTSRVQEEVKLRPDGDGLPRRQGRPRPAQAALDDESPLRRATAVDVLCQNGLAEPRDALRKLLADPKPTVRLRAALALAQARDANAVDDADRPARRAARRPGPRRRGVPVQPGRRPVAQGHADRRRLAGQGPRRLGRVVEGHRRGGRPGRVHQAHPHRGRPRKGGKVDPPTRRRRLRRAPEGQGAS